MVIIHKILMTFERDLFISFSGGFFSGMIIFISTLVIGMKIPTYKKILIIAIYFILFSILYMAVSFLLKKFYNQYIPWRM